MVPMSNQRIKFEEYARRILQRELRRPVVLHDDERKPALYDLRVGDLDAPEIAIECVGAVDSVRTETRNEGPAKGPRQFDLSRDWHVVPRPNAPVSKIERKLEKVLQECERDGIVEFTPMDWWLERRHPRSSLRRTSALTTEPASEASSVSEDLDVIYDEVRKSMPAPLNGQGQG